MPGQIVFVCGHSNWGKSWTLRPLTDGTHQGRWARDVGDARFWVRKMSNDDKPDEYFEWMGSQQPTAMPRLIAALCPKFDDPRLDRLLRALRDRGYQLHFWVMKRQYDGPGVIAPGEISRLQAHGHVEVFSRRADAEHRARSVQAFVRRRVLTD